MAHFSPYSPRSRLLNEVGGKFAIGTVWPEKNAKFQ